MSRYLQWLNLFGIVALAALCCVQWSINQHLTDNVAQSEKTNAQQADTIVDLKQQISEDSSELLDVRQRLDISESARHTGEAQIGALNADRDRLSLEAAQCKKALTAWIAASNARDAIISQANASIKDLSARYAAAVTKYNELAGKYNKMVSPATRSSGK